MHAPSSIICLVVCAFASVASPALAAPPDRYVLLTAVGRIGTLEATHSARTTDVVFTVDDNGRGPKIKEHIELGRDGLPDRWTITGTGWVGAPVEETFERTAKGSKWKTRDDEGSAKEADRLYTPNKGSPWFYALALNKLVTARKARIDLLPSYWATLSKVRDIEVGPNKEKLTAYALWGFGLEPALLLAKGNRFVGQLVAGFVLVDERFADRFDELSALASELSATVLATLKKKVTHPLSGPTWITNVRVFDPVSGKRSELLNVGFEAGTITHVGTAPPPEKVLVIDGEGGTLLPGLFDAHAHMSDWAGLMHIAAGVTFARDPGNDNTVLLDLERRIDAGELVGPRLQKSGFLEGRSPFSANGGFVIETLEEGFDKVRWYAEHGYWGIKIYNSMPPDFVKPLADEAHRMGLHVSGHVPAFMSSERAIRDGFDEIHHINQLVLSLLIDVDKDDTRTPFRFTALGERTAALDLAGEPVKRLIALMKENKIVLDPTLAVFTELLMSRPGKSAQCDENWIEHVPVPMKRDRRSAVLDVKPEQYATYEASWKKLQKLLKLLHESDIQLVPGTDDVAGLTLHSELEMWWEAGIPPAHVLRLATLEGARFLGMDALIGSIVPGKRADLYLVDGDPTRDMRDIRNGRLVIKDMNAYFPDEIHAELGIVPFFKRVQVDLRRPR